MTVEPSAVVDWDAPIFVVSAGRSGSTWLTNILNADRRIAMTLESGIPEYLGVSRALVELPRRTAAEVNELRLVGLISDPLRAEFSALHRAWIRRLVSAFYLRHFATKPFLRIGDNLREPAALPVILTEFPRARFILLVRDGRDFVVSILRYLARFGGAGAEDLSKGLAAHASFWAKTNEALLRDLGAGALVHRVRYEDLVRTPGEAVAQVYAFLGLELPPAVSEFAVKGDQTLHLHHGTSTSPAASIGRYRTELSAADLSRATALMKPMLERLGYPVE